MHAVPLTTARLMALEAPVGVSADHFYRAWQDPHLRAEMLQQSRVLLEGEAPIAAWGVLRRWEGVYAAWAWLTEACGSRSLSIVRQARRDLALAHDRLSAPRIQAEVASDLPCGVRFAELVGFRVEGLLRKYTRGALGDCFMLASIRS